MPVSIDDLGRLITARRAAKGVRAAASEVGISSATLSRVENGHMPDLETFAKLCAWLGKDPNEFLGFQAKTSDAPATVVHFRKKKTVTKETAHALGELILATQAAISAHKKLLSE